MNAINLDFVRGVALVLRGESLKARAFVTHGLSLGTLREKMVRNFIHEGTPERFRVETGLIRGSATTSRQCDILIHEPRLKAPLYRWEDFVVVRADTANAVIEVKSNLNQATFDEMIDIHTSVERIELAQSGPVFIPTFGFALQGVTFDSFLGYVSEVARQNPLEIEEGDQFLNWPLCIAVQDRHYLGFRHLGGSPENPFCFCAIDLNQVTDASLGEVDGMETGYFLNFLEWVLQERKNAMKSDVLFPWFNQLPISDEGKAWITMDGEIHYGSVTPVQPPEVGTSEESPPESSSPDGEQ